MDTANENFLHTINEVCNEKFGYNINELYVLPIEEIFVLCAYVKSLGKTALVTNDQEKIAEFNKLKFLYNSIKEKENTKGAR